MASSYKVFLESRHPIILKQVDNKREAFVDDSNHLTTITTTPLSPGDILIPPLNTDIGFQNILTSYVYSSSNPPVVSADRSNLYKAENFSWHIATVDDSEEIVNIKKLINPIQNQHLCGSCWAMAIAATISDCLVVSKAVNFMPRIAPTYLMMVVPENMGNSQCNGGNPATVCRALEYIPVGDTSCIDYSWCASDREMCTSKSAANHFGSTLGSKLNRNIPGKGAKCYFEKDKLTYQIDSGSKAFFIQPSTPTELFRSSLKAHIIDYGPVVTGYVVFRNFVTGNFTDPAINEGIYFDRADYTNNYAGRPLRFSDYNTWESQVVGFHAVRVLGWGVGKNVQYDNNRFGDVPYWIAANSWGSSWGNMNGFFRIAMYPYNKVAQFGKPVTIKGVTLGGVIMLKATKPPQISHMNSIDQKYFQDIKRVQPDAYYLSTASPLSSQNTQQQFQTVISPETKYLYSSILISVGIIIVLSLIAFKVSKKI